MRTLRSSLWIRPPPRICARACAPHSISLSILPLIWQSPDKEACSLVQVQLMLNHWPVVVPGRKHFNVTLINNVGVRKTPTGPVETVRNTII